MRVARTLSPTVTVALGLGFFPGAAGAQEADPATVQRGKLIFSTKANCSFCHGWAGDGRGEPRAETGPSLRATKLNQDQIREVVQCGRPGTPMPHHDRFAYSDGRCYGMTAAQIGTQKPPESENGLQRPEIDAVVAYVMAKVRGRGAATYDECIEYWGAGAQGCAEYRR